jgi:tryptophan-rich sensory protein
MMVKLIIQKKNYTHTKEATKNTRYRNNKKLSFLVKVLELFLWCPILVLVSNPGIGVQVGALMWCHQVTGL